MTPEERFNNALPYATEYARMLWGLDGVPYKHLPKREDSMLATIWTYKRRVHALKKNVKVDKLVEKHKTKRVFANMLDRLRETSTYEEVLNLCYEAAWLATKNIKPYSDIAEFLYFTTQFRWRISRLLAIHERNNRLFPYPYVSCNLTTPNYDSIIDYSNLNNWHYYLLWLKLGNDFGVRSIGKMTGISKSSIAQEVQKIC